MLRDRFCGIALILVATFASATVQAEPLRSGDAKRWAESMPSVRAWAGRHDPAIKKQLGSAGKRGGWTLYPPMTDEQTEALSKRMSNPMSNLVIGVRQAGMGSEFTSVVTQHGFSSAEQWGRVGDRVLRAYMTLEMEGQGDPWAEMKNNPHISDAQKQQMMAMMGSSTKIMESMADAPLEDVDAVRPHKSLLEKAFSD